MVYIILCLWRNTCSFWIALSPCFLTNFGSEIKLRHGFETHLNRHSDLTGSHERISSIISSGRLRPLGLRCPILSCAQRRHLFTNHNKIGCSLHHRNLCQSIQIAGSLVDLFFWSGCDLVFWSGCWFGLCKGKLDNLSFVWEFYINYKATNRYSGYFFSLAFFFISKFLFFCLQ